MSDITPAAAPFKTIPLGPTAVTVRADADGTLRLRSTETLRPWPAKLTDRLADGARDHPDRVFLGVRQLAAEGWRTVTYAQAFEQVQRIGQALLDRGLGQDRPVAILSGSSIEHALLALACMHVGVPHCPVTPAYSLLSTDFAKLAHVLGLLTPALVFADDGAAFDKALAQCLPSGVEVVTYSRPTVSRASTPFAALAGTPATAAVAEAAAAVQPDSVAKILFTSGSTGMPKGVINTQRMVACNQQMFVQAVPALAATPPVIVSWLPWHHTSGANQMMGVTLHCGGSFYVDDGKPVPGESARTAANLRDVAPTVYFSVPRGFAELIPFLREDATLRDHFFSRLQLLYYSGAALNPSLVQELDALAVRSRGERVPMMCGYGATETAPLALCANWLTDDSGLAGLPVPGCELKLVPVPGAQGKYEARIAGPMVTPGYWRQPQATAALFDAEGFAQMGDALSWVDANDVSRGLAFDGRIAEDFKLSTGTWVGVGALRARLISQADGLLLDAVLAGEGRDEIAALLVPDPAVLHALCGTSPAEVAWTALLDEAPVRHRMQAALDALAARATGSSTFIARAQFLREPPSGAAGELTDKGSINARALLARRADLVAQLYASAHPQKIFTASAP